MTHETRSPDGDGRVHTASGEARTAVNSPVVNLPTYEGNRRPEVAQAGSEPAESHTNTAMIPPDPDAPVRETPVCDHEWVTHMIPFVSGSTVGVYQTVYGYEKPGRTVCRKCGIDKPATQFNATVVRETTPALDQLAKQFLADYDACRATAESWVTFVYRVVKPFAESLRAVLAEREPR